jgi:hypothetical protein
MKNPIPSGRVVRRCAALFGLALLLNFLPIPRFGFAEVSILNRIGLPEMSPVGAAELPQLQAALNVETTTSSVPTISTVSTTSTVPITSTLPGLPNPPSGQTVTEDRVTGSADKVNEFSAIGVLLDEAPTEPILVRVRASDGTWGSWRELGVEADEGPDSSAGGGAAEGNGAAFGTEPLWVQDAIGYELNLSSEDAPAAEIALVRDAVKRTATEAISVAGAAVPKPFGIRMRTEWGARATSTSVGSAVKLAVVHHSASSNDYSPAAVPGVLRSIQAYHMDGRGWSDIAYNFVVDKYGGVWEGRGGGIDKPIIGAHAMGFNTNSVGVMVIGDYSAAQPTAAALESVSQVIGWKLALHRVDPASRVDFTSLGSTKYAAGVVVNLPRVVGHQQVGLTGCPGSIQNAISNIAKRTQEWANPVGRLGAINSAQGMISASGWAYDPESLDSIVVAMIIDGKWFTSWSNGYRSDWRANHPGYGDSHGFAISAKVSKGVHRTCVVARNTAGGVDTMLGCQNIVVK